MDGGDEAKLRVVYQAEIAALDDDFAFIGTCNVGGEIYNLCIGRGALNDEERYKINDHIMQTIIMLERLPFPRHLRADRRRPFLQARQNLSESIKIMSFMVKDNHIDP